MNIYERVQRISYYIRKDRRYSYYDSLVKNLSLSREKMITLQNKLISELVEHAYFKTRYYRKLFDNQGLKPEDIKNKEDLKKIPVLTKSAIRENLSELKSDDHYSKNLEKVTSGGSTGDLSVIYKSPYFTQMSRAVCLRNNLLADWKPGDKTVWIWGAPYEHQQIKDSFISKLGILINRRLLLNAYNYSKDGFPIWVQKIRKFCPQIVYGYASILLEFAKYLKENSISLETVKTVVSTTETLKNRELIEHAFDCNVYNQYGCREILGIGIESSKNAMRLADDAVALNIYNGGEFIVSALHSYGFPLINYKVGDYGTTNDAIVADDKLPFSHVNLTIGRITDNFLTRDNRIVSSSALGTYMSTFELRVLEHQIIQQSHLEFIVNYIPEEGFDVAFYKYKIGEILCEYFGVDTTIEFNEVEKIPVEKSGKKLMFKRMFGFM